MPISILSAQRPSGNRTYRSLDVNTTGALIVGTAATLHDYYIRNNSAGVIYVKLYDKASAPTVGTDTPIRTIGIPATAAANLSIVAGIYFASGIGIGATTEVADNGTTGPTANHVVANIGWK